MEHSDTNIVTIFDGALGQKPFYLTISEALNRIRTGKSKSKVEAVRTAVDKARYDSLKKGLPSVAFAGVFSARGDSNLAWHSGYINLDFDHAEDVEAKKAELMAYDYILAAWVSPRGEGVKALARIADGRKHREHFAALKKVFPTCDPLCANEERLCFESYDPNILVKDSVVPFTQILEVERVKLEETVDDSGEKFAKLQTWIVKSDVFQDGNRNKFTFKLACSCCCYGIPEHICANLIMFHYPLSSSFPQSECRGAIHSGYKRNQHRFGTCEFTKGVFVDRTTRKEIEIENHDFFDPTVKAKDVIYGSDVKDQAFALYDKGHEHVHKLGIPQLDEIYKKRRGEITLWSGIGNYGKSSVWKWYHVCRALALDEKYAVFTPEEMPAEEYYFDLCEIVCGTGLTPSQEGKRPNREAFSRIYDWVDKHFFVVYPESVSPTPAYIKERFLELIIKEGVHGVCVDPFNQMTNDYGSTGGRSDKYLETFLSDCSRFAQQNDVFFDIVAHPKLMQKPKGDNNYPCPDVFDIADGAMWNNKMDNILIFHRQNHQDNPNGSECELHSKKIRRQKIVGKKGVVEFSLDRFKRRFMFGDFDFVAHVMRENEATEREKSATEKPSKTFHISSQDKNEEENEYPF